MDQRIGWLLSGALVLRLLFWLPYYLPGDALNYLNAADIFADRGLGNIIHAVRLGMIAPLALLDGLGGHYLLMLYFLAASLGTVWLVFRLAQAWGGTVAGALAAGVMVLAPMEVAYGTMLLPDGPLSFYALGALFLIVQAPSVGPTRAAVGAGLLLGVAYTCKVTALFFALPALLQLVGTERNYRAALAFLVTLGMVVAGEVVALRLLSGEWHFRIWETLGFAVGSKGQFVDVHKTWGWWLGQIWFKIGALLWGGHLPTTVLLACVPHLTLWALWRLRDQAGPWRWTAAWGGMWVGQQLVISSIEQEPRYVQAALPYAAIAIGLGFAAGWSRWRSRWRVGIVVVACVWSVAATCVFWATFSPQAAAVAALVERLDELETENVRIGGPSEYVLRLAHYRGWATSLEGEGPLTHWARLSNGYSVVVDAQIGPPAEMQLIWQTEFASPLASLFAALGIAPGVGTASAACVYQTGDNLAAYP